jgi:hypothetical protein
MHARPGPWEPWRVTARATQPLLRGAVADGNAAKKELDKFNGKWQAVSVERDGKQTP